MTSTGEIPVERNLRVLIADEDRSRLRDLADVLTDIGHEVAPFAVKVSEAVEIIAREDPDLAIVVLHEDDEHALALIAEAVAYTSGPVIAQSRDADVDFVARAAERGISAWIESITPEALQGAIEVALRRHAEESRLHEKVQQLETALERRSIIERAKGMLMERHSLEERDAFDLLRDHARSQRRRVVDVAQGVCGGETLR